MVVSEHEMKLALEILRTFDNPSLNSILEAVLKFNSSGEQKRRIDFMKMNALVIRMAGTFSTTRIFPIAQPKNPAAGNESFLAVA